MEKINFKDLPDTTTPVTASNLNLLQDNVENDIGDLSDLETEAKNNLVEAINEANQHGSSGSGGETLPVGSEIDFDGTTSDIPTGWEQVDDKAKILWTNPNPTDFFNSQTITLNSSDYDVLEIFYTDYQSTNRYMSQRAIKGKNIILNSLFIFNSNMYMGARVLNYTDATHLAVEKCWKVLDAGSIISPTEANNWIIPQYIIGYKTGLFN